MLFILTVFGLLIYGLGVLYSASWYIAVVRSTGTVLVCKVV